MNVKKLILGLGIIGALIIAMYFSPVKPSVIISGSMEPVLLTNSIVFSDYSIPFEQIEKGDIIRYKTESLPREVTHRVYDIRVVDGQKIIQTKGDNNINLDSWFVVESDYKAKVVGNTSFLKPVIDMVFGDITRLSEDEINAKAINLTFGSMAVVGSLMGLSLFVYCKKRKNKEG